MSCVGAQTRASGLNVFAQCFLLLYKMCHQVSFANIATLFGIPSAQGASNVFYRTLLHQYRYFCNIPSVIFNNQVNQPEVDKLLREAYERTPHYYKVLLNNLEDPDDRDRTPVPIQQG